eukprot:366199-Chlamydomonas_euryale.AAC.7
MQLVLPQLPGGARACAMGTRATVSASPCPNTPRAATGGRPHHRVRPYRPRCRDASAPAWEEGLAAY